MKLPKTRTNEIIEQDLGSELLIYDLKIDKAYTLNATLKIFFKACDGVTTFADLKREFEFTDDLIYFALDELNENNLLENYHNNHFAGMTRREAIRKVGLATMIALPVIIGITAPKAADAASGRLGTQANSTFCSALASGNSQECASGYCVQANWGGTLYKACCAQSSISDRTPILGNFSPSRTSDPVVCANVAAARCCSGQGGLDSFGTCYCS